MVPSPTADLFDIGNGREVPAPAAGLRPPSPETAAPATTGEKGRLETAALATIGEKAAWKRPPLRRGFRPPAHNRMALGRTAGTFPAHSSQRQDISGSRSFSSECARRTDGVFWARSFHARRTDGRFQAHPSASVASVFNSRPPGCGLFHDSQPKSSSPRICSLIGSRTIELPFSWR